MDPVLRYSLWVGFCLFIAIIASSLESIKSEQQIVNDFFSYVKKGRRRVARFTQHVFAFAGFQLLYILVYILGFLFFRITIPFWKGYFPFSFVLFYLYCLWCDNSKKHRMKGVALGYEYPHPATFTIPIINFQVAPDFPLKQVVYAGSKGIYDLQIKSEPNPHAIIVGESGYGKTTTLHAFLARAYLQNFIPFLLIDPSRSYEDNLHVNVWRVPINLKLNPFKLNEKSKEERASIVAELFQDSFDLTDLQASRLRRVLEEFYEQGIEPTPKQIEEKLLSMLRFETSEEMRNSIKFTIEKIREGENVFGKEPKEFWDNVEETCNVVDISHLSEGNKKLVTYLIFQRIIEKFEKKSEDKIKLYIAIDDAYQVLIRERETNITKVVREGRKYGFGVIVSTQMLEDIPKPITANSSVKILHYCKTREAEELKRMFNFTDLEERIFSQMKPGYAFVIDENAVRYGKTYPAFVEIDKLSDYEIKRLSEVVKRVTISGYPIEKEEKVEKKIEKVKVKEVGFRVPEVALYRFLIALHKTKNVSEALKFLKEKGLVVSYTVLYGGSKIPSLFERAKEEGYVNEKGELTDKALMIVDPNLMILNQGARAGGEVHKALMKKVIKMEQEKGNFVFVPKERESFDVGVLVPEKKKGLWSKNVVRAYEIQTTARASEIEQCLQRQREGKYELIFVTNSKKVKEDIQKITGTAYKILVLKAFE